MRVEDVPVDSVVVDDVGETLYKVASDVYRLGSGVAFNPDPGEDVSMISDPRATEALYALGWGGEGDPREWAKRATVPRDVRYYFINDVPHRAVEAVAPDADRCVPIDGGPSVVVKYQDPMHPDDMARELARLRSEPVATVEGRIEAHDFPDGANVACIEVGDDNGDHVRLIIERGPGLRLAAEWPGRLEITVRRKGAK